MRHALGLAVRGMLDLVFPPACVACSRVLPAEAFFCEACSNDVDWLPGERCARCAEPGRFAHGECPRCVARPPAFERAFAPLAHDGAVARAIHQFKYVDHPELAAPLAELLVYESGSFLKDAPELIAAIPLHRTRLHRRRYDQAELLASRVAALTGRRRVEPLTRVRATERQVGLSEASRDANLAGAFAADPAEVRGEPVLLIDDVFTTGATARAAAAALIEAGARSVEILTVARAFTP